MLTEANFSKATQPRFESRRSGSRTHTLDRSTVQSPAERRHWNLEPHFTAEEMKPRKSDFCLLVSGQAESSRRGESIDGSWRAGVGERMVVGIEEEEREHISGGGSRRWRWVWVGMRLGEEGGGREKRWGELGGGAYGWRGGSLTPVASLPSPPLQTSPSLLHPLSLPSPLQPRMASLSEPRLLLSMYLVWQLIPAPPDTACMAG